MTGKPSPEQHQRLSDDLRSWVGDDEPRDYPSPWVRVFIFALFTSLVALIVVGLLVMLGGCASWGSTTASAAKDAGGFFSNLFTGTPGKGGPNYAIISYTASVLFVIGVITLVASFWIPLIPRRASGVCLAVSVGCWVLAYVMDAYLGITVLVLMIAGVAAAAPWVIGWVRLSIKRAGQRLASEGDERAGVALMATVDPRVMKNRKRVLENAIIQNKADRLRVAPRSEVTP